MADRNEEMIVSRELMLDGIVSVVAALAESDLKMIEKYDNVGDLIADVSRALHTAVEGGGTTPAPQPAEKPVPAVSIRSSIKPDYLVCLEDGKKMTMLKRYLQTNYGMTPDQYRARWGLPADYPMVAPNYTETRRAIAKQSGLGLGSRGRPPRSAG